MRPFGLGPDLDPGGIAPALVNRALEHEAWAQACLAAHAGRAFSVTVGPISTLMRIDAEGKVAQAARPDAAPDLKLTVSPLAVPSFLANPARWDEFVAADGDAELAATLKGLAETLPWFVERVFANALGPIVGQRVADAGRRLLAFPEYAAARVGESVTSYARDEIDVAARASEGRAFGDEVAGVASRVDALAARIDALAARLVTKASQAA
jgi:ubiquinone biosynthesis protein UbiJ